MGWREGDVSVVTVYVRRGIACVCMCLDKAKARRAKAGAVAPSDRLAESIRTRRLEHRNFGGKQRTPIAKQVNYVQHSFHATQKGEGRSHI